MKAWVSSWKSSGKVRKQRKYAYTAPLHIKQQLLGAHLSKELRTKHHRRSVGVRAGDSAKVLRGEFRGKTGKIERVLLRSCRVHLSGVELTKRDGSKVPYPLHPSNLLITGLALDDKRRQQRMERAAKPRST